MTWGELKELIDAAENVTDDTEIAFIDVSFANWIGLGLTVSVDNDELSVY